MEKKEAQFEITHGGPELELSRDQLQNLLDSYREQFYVHDSHGPSDAFLLSYLTQTLHDPRTVILKVDGVVAAMAGIHYYASHRDYGNNQLVELSSFAVVKSMRGRKLSTELFRILEEEALDNRSHGQGTLFTLITANEKMKHLAVKNGYREMTAERWVELTQQHLPVEQRKGAADYLHELHIQPYFKETHVEKNSTPLRTGRKGVRSLVKKVLKRFL